MFEAQVAYLLDKYLGRYVSGLDHNSLRISVWRGDLELRGLALKPGALDGLGLPVEVVSGVLGRLKLKVPWSALGRQPVVLELDGVYALARPRPRSSATGAYEDVGRYEAAVAAAELDAKRGRVLSLESSWLQALEARLEAQLRKRGQGPGGSAGGGGLFGLEAVAHSVLGNLQLRIRNVHIRYQDDARLPGGEPLALGLTLGELAAHTVDEGGREAFATGDVLQLMRKAVRLQELGLYFDVGPAAVLPPPPGGWAAAGAALSQAEWDALFLPAHHLPGSQRYPHHHLLAPVSAGLNYTRRAPDKVEAESQARQQVDVEVEGVALALSAHQVRAAVALATAADAAAANAPYRHLRPPGRPAAGLPARLWWRYALLATRLQRSRRPPCSWARVRDACALRRAYVPAYAAWLAGGGALGGGAALAAMEAGLPEGTVLLFRRLAHAQLRAQNKSLAGAGAASGREPPSGGVPAPARRRTGWTSWLWGPSSGATEAAGGSGQGSAGDGTRASDGGAMSGEEWARLRQLLHLEDPEGPEACAGGAGRPETPWTLLSSLDVSLTRASLELIADEGSSGGGAAPLLQASMLDVCVGLRRYPATTAVSLRMGKASAEAPGHGTLLRVSPMPAGAGAAAAEQCAFPSAGEVAQGPPAAVLISYTQAPQDGSADAVLSARLAPAFVTLRAEPLAALARFFAATRALEVGTLQAQAAARLHQLQRSAQRRLAALSARRPALRLAVEAHAPRIVVPDAEGRAALVLNLGCFSLASRPSGASTAVQDLHPADGVEAARLYRCYDLALEQVEATLHEGPFAWPEPNENNSNTRMLPARGSGVSGGPCQAACAAAAPCLSLLSPFGMRASLQVAAWTHPDLPDVRLNLRASHLQLQASPRRHTGVMRVLAALAPLLAAAGGGAGGGGGTLPDWPDGAELEVPVQALTWEVAGGRASRWRRRHLVLRRGCVYLTPGPGERLLVDSRTYWDGWRVAAVPPGSVGGAEHVVMLAPPADVEGFWGGVGNVAAGGGAELESALRLPRSLVLRLDDEGAAAALREQLARSAAMVEAAAGLLSAPSDDLLSSSGSDSDDPPAATDADDAPASAQLTATGGADATSTQLLSARPLLQLSACLPEVTLQLSGRPPRGWDTLRSMSIGKDAAGRAKATPASAAVSAGGSGDGGAARRGAALGAANVAAPGGAVSGAFDGADSDEAEGGEQECESGDEDYLSACSEDSGDGYGSEDADTEAEGDDGGDGDDACEVPLLALRLRGATLAATVRAEVLEADLRVAALRAEDVLMAAPPAAEEGGSGSCAAGRGAGAGFGAGWAVLAHSGCWEEEDAGEGAAGAIEEAHAVDAGGGGAPLAALRVVQSLSSAARVEADTEVSLELAALTLSCHRPTLAALLGLAEDMAAVHNGYAVPTSKTTAPGDAAAPQPQPPTAAWMGGASGVVCVRGFANSSGSGSCGDDGGRSLLRVRVGLQRLQLVLPYELPAAPYGRWSVRAAAGVASQARGLGAGAQGVAAEACGLGLLSPPHLFATAAIDGFSMHMDVRGSGLDMSASLAGLAAEYCALPAGSLYRVIAEVAGSGAASKGAGKGGGAATNAGTNMPLELSFRVHSSEDSRLEPRVPSGGGYASLTVHLRSGRCVLLSRFLMELQEYAQCLLDMQPRPVCSLETAAWNAAIAVTPNEPSSPPPPLLLDLRLDSCVAVVPRDSTSPAVLEARLGGVSLVSRGVQWRSAGIDTADIGVGSGAAAAADALRWEFLQDELQLHIGELGLASRGGPGCRDVDMVQDLGPGLSALLRRRIAVRTAAGGKPPASVPVPPLFAHLPELQVSVQLPRLALCVSEAEHRHTLAVLAGNAAERRRRDPTAEALARVLRRRHRHRRQGLQRALDGSVGDSAPDAKQRGAAVEGAVADGSGCGVGVAARPAALDFSLGVAAALRTLRDDPCALELTLSLGCAELTLLEPEAEGVQGSLRPLAVVALSGLWAGCWVSKRGSVLGSLSLPTVTVEDLRQGWHASTVGTGAGVGVAPTAGGGTPRRRGRLVFSTALDGVADDVTRQPDGQQQQQERGLSPSLAMVEFRWIQPDRAGAGAGMPAADAVTSASAAAAAQPASAAPALGLRVRLQQPQLVLDLGRRLGLLRRLVNFAAAAPVLQGPVPRPYDSRDIVLPPWPTPYARPGGADLWLSPQVRLLADAPGDVNGGGGSCRTVVYDGGGGRLVLPPSRGADGTSAAPEAELPLIAVGPGRELVLRNVVVVNAASLPACLSLGPGARLVAREEDGVVMQPGGEADEVTQAAAVAKSRPQAPRTAMARAAAATSQAPATLSRCEVELEVVNATMHVLDSSSEDEHSVVTGCGGSSAKPAAARAQSTPLPGPGFPAATSPRSFVYSPTVAGKRVVSPQTPSLPTLVIQQRMPLQHLVLRGCMAANVRTVGPELLEARLALRGVGADVATSTPGGPVRSPASGSVTPAALRAGPPPAWPAASSAGSPAAAAAASAGGAMQSPPRTPRRDGALAGSLDAEAFSAMRRHQGCEAPLLDPLDLTATFTRGGTANDPGPGGKDRVRGYGDARLSVDVHSALVLRLSPPALSLVLQLAELGMEPFQVPPPERPLHRCGRFRRLCAIPLRGALHCDATRHAAAAAAAEAEVLTLWRPLPPHGYVAFGDVIGLGSRPPAGQVAALAINSGLIAYPTAYEQAWSGPVDGSTGDGAVVALWRPVPPAGYVALGCVVGPVDSPPPLAAVGCLAAAAAVEAPLGECLPLPGTAACMQAWRREEEEAAAGGTARTDCVPTSECSVWRVQNAAASFVVTAPGQATQGPVFNMRTPLGVAPAALILPRELQRLGRSLGGQRRDRRDMSELMAGRRRERKRSAQRGAPSAAFADSSLSFLCQLHYLNARMAARQHATRRALQAPCADFVRVWQGDTPTGSRLAVWRPRPPAGYAFVGDCVVVGSCTPPATVSVLLDSSTDGAAAAAAEGDAAAPPLARPLGFHKVWDSGARLVLWRPVPPPGYVAVGCVAGVGPQPPADDVASFRVVRADLTVPASVSVARPDWILPHMGYSDSRSDAVTGVCGWVPDYHTGAAAIACQAVLPLDGTLQVPRLNLPQGATEWAPAAATAQAGDQPASHADSSLQLRLCAPAVLQLCSAAGRPVLELEAAEARLGWSIQGPGASSASACLSASAWTLSGGSLAGAPRWEPLLEPTKLGLHVDVTDAGSGDAAGAAAATGCESRRRAVAVRLATGQEAARLVVAHSGLRALLAAVPAWAEVLLGPSTTCLPGHMAADGPPGGSTVAGDSAGWAPAPQQRFVTNALGTACTMLVDSGEAGQAVVELPPGADGVAVPVLPLPPPGAGYGAGGAWAALQRLPAPQPAAPAVVLRVDVVEARGVTKELVHPGASLLLALTVGGPAAEGAAAAGNRGSGAMPLLTRAVRASQLDGAEQHGGPGSVAWRERFLVRLPPGLSAQLLASSAAGSSASRANIGDPPLLIRAALMLSESGAAESGGPLPVVAAGTHALTHRWLAGSMRNALRRVASLTRPSPSSTAAAGSTDSGAETVEVRLFGTIRSDADEEPVTLLLHLSLDEQQVAQSWPSFLAAAALGSGSATHGGDSKAEGIGGEPADVMARAAAAVRRRVVHGLQLAGDTEWAAVPCGNAGTSLGIRGRIPVHAGPGVVIEQTADGGDSGAVRELLRSRAVLRNDTQLPLEVALAFICDSGGLAASTASSFPTTTAVAKGADGRPLPVVESVFETQRYLPLRGWSSKNLLPHESRAYCRDARGGQGSGTFPLVPLPPGWEWEGPWRVDLTGHVDGEGWFYATASWNLNSYPPAPEQARCGATDLVRRRRWTRSRRCVEAAAAVAGTQPPLPAQHLSTGASSISSKPPMRRLLGTLSPGERLPLPLGWEAAGCELQVRPLLPQRPPPHTSDGAAAGDGGIVRSPQQAEARQGHGKELALFGGLDVKTSEPTLLHNRTRDGDIEGALEGLLCMVDDVEARHAWSTGPGAGAPGLVMARLGEGGARLLVCRPMHSATYDDDPFPRLGGQEAGLSAAVTQPATQLPVSTPPLAAYAARLPSTQSQPQRQAPCGVGAQHTGEVQLAAVQPLQQARAPPKAPVVEEVFETQRYLPLRGWSSKNLLPHESRAYCRDARGGQGSGTFPEVPLPPGWEWEGPWKVDLTSHVDAEGWFYATASWNLNAYPPAPEQARCGATDLVRRRRWTRSRRCVEAPLPLPPGPAAPAAVGLAAPAHTAGWSAGADLLSNVGDILGRTITGSEQAQADLLGDWVGLRTGAAGVPAGDGGGAASGYDLLGEEVMAAEAAEPAYVPRPSLQQGVQCSPSGAHKAGGIEDQPCWLSVALEAEVLEGPAAAGHAAEAKGSGGGSGGGGVSLLDWRLVVRPPLTLRNMLPVGGRYVVWEGGTTAGGRIRRQEGSMGPGESVAVHAADMRRQVFLSFAPNGCELSEPVLLSEGYTRSTAGVTGAAASADALPDSLLCPAAAALISTTAKVVGGLYAQPSPPAPPLTLELLREMDVAAFTGGGGGGGGGPAQTAPGTAEWLPPGVSEAAAAGYPLSVSLRAPLWVQNDTELPLRCAVVAAGEATRGSVIQLGQKPQPPQQVHVAGPAEPLGRGAACIQVAPGSVLPLSLPAGDDAEDEGRGVALAVSLAGGAWSQLICLPSQGSAADGDGVTATGDSDASACCVLIRLPSPDGSRTLEAVLRLLSPDGTNRTAAAAAVLGGGGSTPGGGGSGGVSPGALRAAAGSLLLRLEPALVAGNTCGVPLLVAQPAMGSEAGASSQEGDTALLAAPEAALTLPLAPGNLAMPLHWAPSAARHRRLCLALPLRGAALESAAAAGVSTSLLWSDPVSLEPNNAIPDVEKTTYAGDAEDEGWAVELQLALPVYCLGRMDGGEKEEEVLPLADGRQSESSRREALRSAQEAVGKLLASLASEAWQRRTGAVGAADMEGGGGGHDQMWPVEAACMGLARMVRRVESGFVELLALPIVVGLESRAPGCLRLVASRLGGPTGHMLLNTTPSCVLWRPSRAADPATAGTGAAASGARGVGSATEEAWLSAPPFSCEALLVPGRGTELELRAAGHATAGALRLSLEVQEEHEPKQTFRGGGGGSRGCLRCGVLPARHPSLALRAQALSAKDCDLTPTGRVVPQCGGGGIGLGATTIPGVLRLTPLMAPSPSPGGQPPVLTGQHTGLQASEASRSAPVPGVSGSQALMATAALVNSSGGGMQLTLVAEVPSLELCLVDDGAEEIAVLSLRGLKLDGSMGVVAGGGRYLTARMRLDGLQLDDMTPGSVHPVVLRPLDEQQQQQASSGRSNAPVFEACYSHQPDALRHALRVPSLLLRLRPLRLAIGESLVWRLAAFASSITLPDVDWPSTSDPLLAVELLEAAPVRLHLSFAPQPASRPGWARRSLLMVGVNLAQIDDAEARIRGMRLESCRLHRSRLLSLLATRATQELTAAGSSLLRTFVLRTGVRTGLRAAARTAGLVALGVVAPGAVAAALVVGTGLSARSAWSALSGQAATEAAAVAASGGGGGGGCSVERECGRVRLQRACGGAPFRLEAALGTALLAALAARTAGAALRADRYVQHWLCAGGGGGSSGGGGGVLLATDRRVMLVEAPEFATLHRRLATGAGPSPFSSGPNRVPATGAAVRWDVPWVELLAAEVAAWHDGGGGPAGAATLLLHRTRPDGSGRVFHSAVCGALASTAPEVLGQLLEVRATAAATGPSASGALLLRRRPQPGVSRSSSSAAANTAGSAAASTVPATPPPERPDWVMCSDFELVWTGPGMGGAGGGIVSVWRPVAPPGYAAVSDVAVTGREAPPRPVCIYSKAAVPPLLSSTTCITVNPSSGTCISGDAEPLLAAPLGYLLLFRSSAPPALTLWRPVAPRGYVELGCVAWPALEEPPPGLVACVRADRAVPGRVAEAPVWGGPSSDYPAWRSWVWAVRDGEEAAFVATRGGEGQPRPPAGNRVWRLVTVGPMSKAI